MDTKLSTNSLSKSQSGGALKLLDDLDELASLLGTDISKPRVWKSRASESRTISEEPSKVYGRVDLGKVTSLKGGETFSEALKAGRLDILTGNYRDATNTTHRLAVALDQQLLNPDSAAFVHPDTREVTGIREAITHGYIQKTGHYLDPSSGKRLKLKECLERYIIVPRDVDRELADGTKVEVQDVEVPPLDLAEKQVVEVRLSILH